MQVIVDPYRLHPVAPEVAVLLEDGRVVGEHGDLLELETLPKGIRVWGSYETVYALVRAGKGEALCWNQEEIRWRHRAFEDQWKQRPSDVAVIKLPFPQEPEAALAGLAAWRDWLSSYGAAPSGTSGSAAWSLLRARLGRTLFCGSGDLPPIGWTVGGRQELGPAGQGSFAGVVEHVDLPAAYASTLGELRYGGRWVRTGSLAAGRRPASFWAAEGRPVFVRARVRVPDGLYGPLVRRPRRRPSGLAAALLGQDYPSGRVLQGCWTFQELEAASRHGARVAELEAWVHLAGERRPFWPWWEAIVAGRSLRDPFARSLAKVTGNALWGRFCMDARAGGLRTIRSRGRSALVSRPVRAKGGIPPAHDLAETVSGRVRARLFEAMVAAGERLVSAHTDGVWMIGGGEASGDRSDSELERSIRVTGAPGWRLKEQARRLDVLSPQTFRYWPVRPAPWEPAVVFSGVPAERAPESFEREWVRAGFDA